MKNGHYVATRVGTDTVDYAHSNRGYWTDGEDSQRAPSERTLSEYTTANERNTSPPHLQNQQYRTDRALNAGPKPLYGPPPTRVPPRAPSAMSYEHGGDTGSDIYVTSAAYRAPSEYRYNCDINYTWNDQWNGKQWSLSLFLWVCGAILAVIHNDQLCMLHEVCTR